MDMQSKLTELIEKRADMVKQHEQLVAKLQETVANIHQLDGAIGVLNELSASPAIAETVTNGKHVAVV